MKKFLAVLLLAFAGCATAPTAEVVREFSTARGDSLVLLDAPCVATRGFFSTAPRELLSELKSAVFVWEGQALEACWTKDSGLVFVIDETGDYGYVDAPGSPFVDGAKGEKKS